MLEVLFQELRLALGPLSSLAGLKAKWGEEALERHLHLCQQMRPYFSIFVDTSPVMQSKQSYAARLEHDSRVITLNGHLMKASAAPAAIEEFLILHELSHALGLSEAECDAVALYGLSTKI